MATVKNISAGELRLLRVPRPHLGVSGVNVILAAGTSGTIPDDFIASDGIQALLTATSLEISAFDPLDTVVAGEAAQINSVYLITLDNVPGDWTNTDNVAAIDTGGAGTYDFSNPADRALTITLNGVAVTHAFLPGDFATLGAGTAAEVATSLTGNTAFAAEATAADAAGSIEITSKVLGTSSTIISTAGGAATLLTLSTSSVAGTGAPSSVQVLAKKTDGTAAPGVTVNLKAFDTITGGALLANVQVQFVTKGSVSSGIFTNDAVAVTDAAGELDFELGQALGGTDDAFLDLTPTAGFFLADSDTKGSDSSRDTINRPI